MNPAQIIGKLIIVWQCIYLQQIITDIASNFTPEVQEQVNIDCAQQPCSMNQVWMQTVFSILMMLVYMITMACLFLL